MPTVPSKTFDHPTVQLSGTDGNVFALLGTVTRALRSAGHDDMAAECTAHVLNAEDYDAALQALMAYVDAR